MRRGNVVIVQELGSPASKARPCVIVQRHDSGAIVTKVTVCPLTSQIGGPAEDRSHIAPTAANNLRKPSDVEVDRIFTHPVQRIGRVIGHLDQPAMDAIDIALRRWLDL